VFAVCYRGGVFVAFPSSSPASSERSIEDEELDDSVLGELVDSISDEALDDEAAGVESEVSIDEPPELLPDEEDELDTGGALDEVPLSAERAWNDDDSTLGLDEVDSLSELEPLTPLEPGNLPDGPDEPLPRLDLPEIDEEDGDEPVAAQTTSELPAASSYGDEPLPPASEQSWVEGTPSIELEACSALSLSAGTALAASTDLLWFSRGEVSPLRLEAGATRIHSVALIGEAREFALCSTTSGRLLRRGRSASAPEELRAPRPLPDARGLREPLDLHQPPAWEVLRVLARSASGLLLGSEDGGGSFQRISEQKALAIAGSGWPVAALSERGHLLSCHDGQNFSERALAGVPRAIARDRLAMVAASRDVVVIGSAELGLTLSTDGGGSFDRVAGTCGVTALTAAPDGAGERVFAALKSEAHDRSTIVEIDPRSGAARSIAVIANDVDPEASDRVRVLSLAWDEEQSRLWVAGEFGVKVFAPPGATYTLI
jgi:hypothetical protein